MISANRATRGTLEHQPLSALLTEIGSTPRERISVQDLLDAAGDRAFGALVFFFAAPNVIPTPPGTSTVLGLPLVLLAFQLLIGRRAPWLPKVVGARSLERSHFVMLIERAVPVLRAIERVLKPRLSVLVSPIAERLLGLWLFILSVVLFLPIPFGNMLPAAAICLIALALLEHDGLAAIFGSMLGVAAILFIWGALVAVLRAGLFALEHLGLM